MYQFAFTFINRTGNTFYLEIKGKYQSVKSDCTIGMIPHENLHYQVQLEHRIILRMLIYDSLVTPTTFFRRSFVVVNNTNDYTSTLPKVMKVVVVQPKDDSIVYQTTTILGQSLSASMESY
jgi:hypothetical protein